MAVKQLDAASSKEMATLCQKLTHTGEESLDDKLMQKFELLCKQSNSHMRQAFILLMSHLEKKHSEVRYGALLVCDKLFKCHEFFRELLIDDIQTFIQFTMGIDKQHPLPPPKIAAKILRDRAIIAMSEWNCEFHDQYIDLESAYEYLRDCHQVDFKSIEKERSLEILKKQEEERKLKAKENEKNEKTNKEIMDFFEDAHNALVTLQNCIDLLLPPPEDFFITGDEESDITYQNTSITTQHDSDSDSVEMREYGVLHSQHAMTLTLQSAKVIVNDDNLPLVENAREAYQVIVKKHLSKVRRWKKVLTKDKASKNNQAERVLKLYDGLTKAMKQYSQLGLEIPVNTNQAFDDSETSDDSELEEVETKEGYEERVGDALLAEWVRVRDEQKEKQKELFEAQQTSSQQSKRSMSPKPSSSRSQTTTMPTNIEEWQEKDIPIPHIIKCGMPDTNQIWLSASVSQNDDALGPTVSSVPVEYTSEQEPVKWECRTPLPSGKLCPRMDRHKCPLHGPVVPRNKLGQCTRPEDAKAEIEREELRKQQNPDWQDPQLLAELKESTGIDLTMPVKGKRKKKEPEFPGLTDLKKKNDSPRKRLAKKIFKRNELRKTTTLETEIGKKKREPFFFDT